MVEAAESALFFSKKFKVSRLNYNNYQMILTNVVIFDLVLDNSKYCFILIYRPLKSTSESNADASKLNSLITSISKPIFILEIFLLCFIVIGLGCQRSSNLLNLLT